MNSKVWTKRAMAQTASTERGRKRDASVEIERQDEERGKRGDEVGGKKSVPSANLLPTQARGPALNLDVPERKRSSSQFDSLGRSI